MILLVDAGNSRLKWAYYSTGTRSKQFAEDYCQYKADILLPLLLKKKLSNIDDSISKLILVSVLGNNFSQKIKYACQILKIELQIIRSQAQAYGVKNSYIEPQRLGADRSVGMIAAHHLRPERHCIIVSCGTAVTIDAITVEGVHMGGLILPGLSQFSEQLIKKSALLSIQGATKTTLFANNTADALASGRVYGLVEAINGISSRMKIELLKINDLMEKPDIMYPVQIILCGGDAKLLHPYLNESTQREDDWLMQGLQLIAELQFSTSMSKPSGSE
jgi:type III pantothenate kinase